MKRRILTLAIVVTMLANIQQALYAQHDLGIYNMEMVPQRIFQNPSFMPEGRYFIGIPVLSGIQSTYANPFAYNDVIELGNDDSLTFMVENMLGKITVNDQFRLNSNIDIFSFGIKTGKDRFYLAFSVRERMNQLSVIPVNLGNLLWYGNASPQLFGKQVNIAPSIYFSAYDEWGLSLSGYAMQKKLTWGGRVKYLSGRIDITTTKSQFDVFTDTSSYQFYMRSDVEIQTSGIDDIEHYLDQPVSKLVFPGNNGMGLDLGASYQVNDRLNINASVLDIGFIRWKSQTLAIVSSNPGEEFVFDGVSLESFMEMISNMNSFGTKLADSIMDLVQFDSIYDRQYTSWLPVRYNLGGTYTFGERHHVNLLLNAASWHQTFHPALSASYSYKIPGFLGLLVSYNLFNNQYTNFGAGFSIYAGPVQIYAVSDNVPGFVFYRSTNNYSFQFGINLVIGRKSGITAEIPKPGSVTTGMKE